MSKPDDGPAFPFEDADRYYPGMMLSDYFMASAPITVQDAMVACAYDSLSIGVLSLAQRLEVFEQLACMRKQYANAMLAERVK